MPTYVVTGPDGQEYEIVAPEGASEADVMAYAQRMAPEADRAGGSTVEGDGNGARRPSEEQLAAALRKADAAAMRGEPGAVEDARALAREIRSLRGEVGAAQPEPLPSLFRMDSDFRERSGVGAPSMLWAAAKDMFGSRQGAGEYLAGQAGGRVVAGEDGEPLVELRDGTRYRLNDPGLDSTDVANFSGNVGAFATPAGWAARAGQAQRLGLAGHAGLQAIAAGSTDAGLQLAFNDGEVDPDRVMISGAAGAGGQYLSAGVAQLARLARGRMPEPVHDAIAAARELKIPLSVAQTSASPPVQAATAATKWLPFSGSAGAAKRQQEAFNRAVGQTFGVDAPYLTDDAMRAARGRLNQTFEEIYGRNSVALTPDVVRRMAAIEREAFEDLTTAEAQVVRNQLDKVLREAGDGLLSGKKYQALRTSLRGAEDAGKIGRLVRKIRGELDDAAVASVGADDAARLAKVRSEWANLRTVEEALRQTTGAGGSVRPSSLWPLVRKGSTKEMRELAKVGQLVLKDGLGDSGTAQRAFWLNTLGGAGAGVGLTAGAPVLAKGLATGAVVGRVLNSNLASKVLEQGKPTSALARLVRPAPVVAPSVLSQLVSRKDQERAPRKAVGRW